MKTYSRTLVAASVAVSLFSANALAASHSDVVTHYADLAHATFQDAVTTAEVLGEVVDARLWPVC